jgi:uncharacterized protein YbjQ (UPF0145 family)
MHEIVRCENCNKETYAAAISCPHCGVRLPSIVPEEERAEALENANETGDFAALPLALQAELSEEIVLTTASSVVGREIDHELEIITAECVYGMNIFKDFFAGLSDIFGGRSRTTQKVLRDARKTCLLELRREAMLTGADAVIGVQLAYSELSGGGKNGMLFLVASGTAVKLRDQQNAS